MAERPGDGEPFPPGTVVPQNPPSPTEELPYDVRPGPAVNFVREQYRINFEKQITLTTGAAKQLLRDDAAIVLLITDSVIQWSVVMDITVDSPQLAGTTSLYDKIVVGVQNNPKPKYVYYKLASGSTGNLWIVAGT